MRTVAQMSAEFCTIKLKYIYIIRMYIPYLLASKTSPYFQVLYFGEKNPDPHLVGCFLTVSTCLPYTSGPALYCDIFTIQTIDIPYCNSSTLWKVTCSLWSFTYHCCLHLTSGDQPMTKTKGRFHSRLVCTITKSPTILVTGIAIASIRFHSRCFPGIRDYQRGDNHDKTEAPDSVVLVCWSGGKFHYIS